MEQKLQGRSDSGSYVIADMSSDIFLVPIDVSLNIFVSMAVRRVNLVWLVSLSLL